MPLHLYVAPRHKRPRHLELTSVQLAQSVLKGGKATRLGRTHAAVVAAPYVLHHRIPPRFPSYIRFQWRSNGMNAKAHKFSFLFILFLDPSVSVSRFNVSQKFQEKYDRGVGHGCRPQELRFAETKRRGRDAFHSPANGSNRVSCSTQWHFLILPTEKYESKCYTNGK